MGSIAGLWGQFRLKVEVSTGFVGPTAKVSKVSIVVYKSRLHGVYSVYKVSRINRAIWFRRTKGGSFYMVFIVHMASGSIRSSEAVFLVVCHRSINEL
jgi:hypothetical protein